MKKLIRKVINNKTPFAFVIKIVILIGLSYFVIQLSNKAKNIEETKYIPDMKNSLDYAEHYITWRYGRDWEKLGYIAKSDGLYYLIPRTAAITWELSRGYDILLQNRLDSTKETKDIDYIINIPYGEETPIMVTFWKKEDYASYQILYENGHYVSNPEMEKYSGIATDEIINHAEEMCASFESELQKMHEYQIEKVRKRRKNLANLGFILFAIYMFYKWRIIMAEAIEEDKPTEQCLGETIVNTINKFARWKYVLCGAAILFCIYILRPVISQFILFQVERNANIYIAYGMSAVVIAIAGCSIITRKGAETSENVTTRQTTTWKILQMMAGCILEMLIIRLGMMLVSDFYPRSLQFYMINGTAWIGAVFLMLIFRGIRYLLLKKRLSCNQEKVD